MTGLREPKVDCPLNPHPHTISVEMFTSITTLQSCMMCPNNRGLTKDFQVMCGVLKT